MRYSSFIMMGVLFMMSCEKDVPDPDPVPQLDNGMAVLCEGLFQQNNSSISWVDLNSSDVDNDLFLNSTERNLGDTGNDMERYGGKVYIVVNVSSVIEVVSANDFSPIKQIDMKANGVAKSPRSIAFYGNHAYVTCYDGFVDVIDTTSLNVVTRIPVGNNPEDLAIVNNQLYVSNSGGLSFPNVDSTVSVIDLTTNIELERIPVGKNPGKVIADAQGDIYVIRRGDYGAVPSRLVRINTQTNEVAEIFGFDVTDVAAMNDDLLILDGSNVSQFSPISESLTTTNFVDMSNVITPYKIQFNPTANEIYILDAMNYTNTGYVRSFNASGGYVSSYNVGLNPSKILLYD